MGQYPHLLCLPDSGSLPCVLHLQGQDEGRPGTHHAHNDQVTRKTFTRHQLYIYQGDPLHASRHHLQHHQLDLHRRDPQGLDILGFTLCFLGHLPCTSGKIFLILKATLYIKMSETTLLALMEI